MTQPSQDVLPSAAAGPPLTPGCDFQSIDITEQLLTRTRHRPDYKAENIALGILAQHMADDPQTLLQKLSEVALSTCHADAAGISIAEVEDGQEIFRWRAVAGTMASHVGGTMPRHFSPCGETLKHRKPLLLQHLARHYTYVAGFAIPMAEVLLVPFFHKGKTVGTLWVVSHERTPAFESEHARIITSFSQFAAAALDNQAALTETETTKRQLEEAQTKLEAALDAGAIATWSWDSEHNRVYADRYCARLFSIPESEAQGAPLEKFMAAMHPDDVDRVGQQIGIAIRTGETYEVEYRVRSPEEGYRWVIARGKPLRDAQGRSTFFPGVVVDITTRKEAQLDIEARQRALWRGLPVPCYTLDAEGIITFYNDAAARLWGRSPEVGVEKWSGAQALTSVNGQPIPLDQSPPALSVKELRGIQTAEMHVIRPDGTQRWIVSHTHPVSTPNDTFAGVINVMHDVTDERGASTALREARDQAVAASRAKDEFIAALSHELRTPLNPVLLLASAAATNEAYDSDARADFDIIRKNIELEARLIDDLLDVTRIVRGKLALNYTVTDLHTIVQDAASQIQVDASRKGIQIQWHLHAPQSSIKGDAVRLQQVFWNVLKNAVKFTHEGGLIRIESTNPPGSETIAVRVQDSGIGIKSSELAGIFEAFAQGNHSEHGTTHFFGGLGLGLAISQEIMARHQGSILADSAGPGQGATFTIAMPLSSEVVDEQSSFSDLTGSAQKTDAKFRILVVEDHLPTRKAMELLLSRRGHQVRTASTGREALREVSHHSFDILICDLGLPDTDGHTLLQEIRQRTPNLPALAMTGYGTDNDVKKSKSVGFQNHLTKPVSIHQLEEALAQFSTRAIDESA